MPPRTKFDRQSVIEAALEIAQREGISGITARKVAGQLGASVAPIYANFENIDDLVAAVVERVFALSGELVARQRGDDPLENIGRASIAFAREYPVLFRDLVMRPNAHMDSYDALEDQLLEMMAGDERMQDWNRQDRRRLLFKLRAIHMGLSTMTAVGLVPSWLDEDEVEDILLEMGEELMLAASVKREERSK